MPSSSSGPRKKYSRWRGRPRLGTKARISSDIRMSKDQSSSRSTSFRARRCSRVAARATDRGWGLGIGGWSEMAELVRLMSAINRPDDDGDPRSSILDPRSSGKQYWRSLEELAETEEFQELLHREFPENAIEWSDPVGRRKFLKMMGASFALAGLTAC